tara:strand:+ start:1015 stop:1452 length:438 start_codon:yes stop_codon:yes gene_type:complete
MKNIFFLLFIFSIASLSAQIDYSKKLISKKFQTATLNYDDNQYYFDNDAVYIEIQLVPEENYYLVSFDGKEEEKIAWEYVQSKESVMIYQDEDNTRLDFDLKSGQILVYDEYNETTGFYENVMILSELEIVRKKSTGGYIPQSIR